jgi:hypothetical protein
VWFADAGGAWHVALRPDGLTLACRRWGQGRGAPAQVELQACVQAAPGVAPWQPALGALSTWLAARPQPPRTLRVVLSGHFVRWQLLPWSDALVRPEELGAYAALRLREVFGPAAERWQVAYAAPAPGHAVAACGVDAELLVQLRAVCASTGTRLESVTPYAAAAFGHWRHTLGRQSACFGVLEPGVLLLGLLRGGRWHSLRSERVPVDGPRIAVALRRMQMQQGIAAGEDGQALPLFLAGVGELPWVDAGPAVRRLAPRWTTDTPSARMALGL